MGPHIFLLKRSEVKVRKTFTEVLRSFNFDLQTTRGQFETTDQFLLMFLQAARPLLMSYIKDFPDEVRLKGEPCQL